MLLLFDKYVVSVLSYVSEILGFFKGDVIEKMYLEYFKIMLKVRKNILLLMVFNR